MLNTAQENLMKSAKNPSLPDRPRCLWRFFSTVICPSPVALATIQAIDGINASWLTFCFHHLQRSFDVFLMYISLHFYLIFIFIISDCIKTNSATSNHRHPLCHWVRLCTRTFSIQISWTVFVCTQTATEMKLLHRD